MARATYAQNSFHGGEWSQAAQGRFDLPAYRTSMNVCLNGIPLEEGVWTRRPGTIQGAFTRNGAAARAIKWDFDQVAPYTMEYTDSVLRLFAGQSLVVNTDSQAVSAISSASPAEVTTAGSHGWADGQQFLFQDLSVADPLLQNRQFVGTKTAVNKLTLADAVTGAALDGSLLLAFGTGTISRITEIATPYALGQWSTLRVVQVDTDAVLLQKAVPPQFLSATPPNGATPASFTLNPALFVDGPYLDPVIGATVTPASTSGVVGFTMVSPTWSSSAAYNTGDFVLYSSVTYKSLIDTNLNNQPDTATFAWVAVAQDTVIGSSGLTSSDLGRHIRLLSEPLDWASGTTYAAGDPVKYKNAYWSSIVSTNTGNIPGVDATKWAITPGGANWTWGKITSLTGAVATQIAQSAGLSITGGVSGGFVGGTGKAAAFDGVFNEVYPVGAIVYNGGNVAGSSYLGKNFTGVATAVSFAKVYASIANGFAWNSTTSATSLTLNLRAKATAPASSSDGTLLGTAGGVPYGSPGYVAQIFSNDTITTWNYIWVEFVLGGTAVAMECAELEFYTTTSFSGTGFSAQIIGPPLQYTSAITTWRLGAFSPALGYAACGTLHEGRLWLSGYADNRLDASALVDINGNAISTLFNFSPTLSDLTVSDACAINYTLKAPDVNPVFWMQPDAQGILVGTQAGEWLVQATTISQVLSPLNIQAHRVTKIGCANIEPRRTEHTNIFVQKHQHKLMEYFSDIFSGKFTAPNLSERAKHLANRGLAEIAYQQELSPTIWARCNDGSLIGAAYKRDTLMTSQGPTFIGWHRHTLGSGRTIESITVGPSAATARDAVGTLDTLAMVTSDGTYRQVEFLTNFFDETTAATDAWFVDSGVVGVTAQAVISGGQLGMKITGLWPLNGKTCAVFCGGFDCGDFAVANGVAFVPYSTSFTQAFATAAARTIVGFTYNSDGQLVRAATPQESGARSGPALGKKRRTDHAAWLFVQTQGISYGVTFDLDAAGKSQLQPANFKTPGGTLYAVNALYSGVWWDTLKGGDDYDSMICWRISRPYPATIAAIEGWLDTKDA